MKADVITWDGKLFKDATITEKDGEGEIEDSGLKGVVNTDTNKDIIDSIMIGCFELR